MTPGVNVVDFIAGLEYNGFMRAWRRALVVLLVYIAAWAFMRPSSRVDAADVKTFFSKDVPGLTISEAQMRKTDVVRSTGPVSAEDDLRDAPSGAMRYALWSGPAAPTLLQGGRVPSADALRRADRGIPAAIASLDREPVSEDGLFVSVDIDISAHPGEYRDAVAEVSARSGLRLDQRYAPAFADDTRRRVTVRGWIFPSRLGDIFGAEVQRVNVERSPVMRSLPDMSTTDILVGVRVPAGESPSAVLAQVLSRLSERAAFRLRRIVGYQMIPGTSQMALILSARVPVPYLERVLRDPAVVKIVPSPDSVPVPEEESSGPMSKRFLKYAVSQRPTLLLGTFLLTLIVAVSALLRSKKD